MATSLWRLFFSCFVVRTPLHLAACAGSSKIVEELLKHGANPNEWDSEKEHTALHCAAAIGDQCSIRCLLKYGANVDAGLPGRSPLHYAVLSNASECVEMLLSAGACPNNPQVYTETPLHVAAGLGAATSVALLLSHGADVRVQCGSARSTPLHLAAEEGSPVCTKLLLDAGAPCDAKNSRYLKNLQIEISNLGIIVGTMRRFNYSTNNTKIGRMTRRDFPEAEPQCIWQHWLNLRKLWRRLYKPEQM